MKKTHAWYRPRLGIMTLALATGAVVGAAGMQVARPTGRVMPRAATSGCDNLIVVPLDRTGKPLSGAPAIAPTPSGPITNIPEFHDCQRFMDAGSEKYGALYAIFAAFGSDTLKDTLAFTHFEVPVATIYSWGGTYPPLGIRPGFNCLYLFYVKDQGKWNARLVPQNTATDPDCTNKHPAPNAGSVLEVHDTSFYGYAIEDYPAVARWDWDSVNRHHYIGVRCGPAWCEVGESGFKRSAMCDNPGRFEALLGTPTAHPDRVYRVKGWYDEQQLAELVGGQLVPSKVRGCLFPNPDLDALTLHSDDTGHHDLYHFPSGWVQVAKAYVTDDYKKIFKKGINDIYMCYDNAGPCKVPLAQTPTWGTRALGACDSDPNPPSGKHWWAMIVWPDLSKHFECIKRRDHAGDLKNYETANPPYLISIPGTTRWHWILQDEQGWVKCPSGCCTGQ